MAAPTRKRVVICPICKKKGHYAKSCLRQGNGAKASGKGKAAADVRRATATIGDDNDSASDCNNSVDEDNGDEMINEQDDGGDSDLAEEDDDDGKLDWVEIQMPRAVEMEEGFDVFKDPNLPEFKGLNAGPSRHCYRERNPKTVLDYFFLFWAVETVLSVFVKATNSYASATLRCGRRRMEMTSQCT
jgi:hypothetical protein